MPEITPEKVELTQASDDFFRTLPGDIYPQALVDQYPRIANMIVELREDRAKLKIYFDSLLNDSRGGRHGFPFSVMLDIQNLRDRLLPADPGDIWV
jgi:hypothetical protein